MAGTSDDVQKVKEARASRLAEARAAADAKESARLAQIAEDDRLRKAANEKWPVVYAILRGIFDTWQPDLEELGIEAVIGGARPGETRYMFEFFRKDGRAATKIWFNLLPDLRLNAIREDFEDTSGTHQRAVMYPKETEEALRPIFKEAISDLESYDSRAGTKRQTHGPKFKNGTK